MTKKEEQSLRLMTLVPNAPSGINQKNDSFKKNDKVYCDGNIDEVFIILAIDGDKITCVSEKTPYEKQTFRKNQLKKID